MKLKEFVDVARAYRTTEDWVEQVALAVCYTYGFKPEQVNDMKKEEFLPLCAGMERKLRRAASRPIYYRRLLVFDATTITYGQFVEVMTWVKMFATEDGAKKHELAPDSIPLIAASILRNRKVGRHKKNVARLQEMNVRRVLMDVRIFMQSFTELIESYSGLFERKQPNPEDATEEEIEQHNREAELTEHPFIEQYGWQYNAKQIAEYERITVDQAYDLPVLQALNDLAFLKAEIDYRNELKK